MASKAPFGAQHDVPQQLVRVIRRHVADGRTAREIAKLLEIPRARVHRIARRHNIAMPLGLGRNARCLNVVIPAAIVPVLDQVAAGAEIGRAELARRILAIALDGDGKAAIRLLGVKAQPKRPYGVRAAEEAAQRAGKAAAKSERLRAEEERRQAEAADLARRITTIPQWLREAVAAGQHPLRAVRVHLGLRQVDVAERAHMGFHGDKRVGRIELGYERLVSKMAQRLGEAMGVDPVWLTGSALGSHYQMRESLSSSLQGLSNGISAERTRSSNGGMRPSLLYLP